MTTTETPLRVVEKADAVAEAAAAGAPPALGGRQSVTIPLTNPIEAHGERLTALTLRPLTVADIVDLPIDILDKRKVDAATVNDYIVRLGGIPRSSVLQLDPGDWFEIMLAVVGFFGKQARTS